MRGELSTLQVDIGAGYLKDAFHPQPYESPIELVGEYFAARGKRPRPLTLTIDHAPKKLKDFLNSFGYRDAAYLNVPREGVKDRIDVVTVARKAILDNANFREWLADELIWRTPVSVSHIVSSNDKESTELAGICAGVLRRFRPNVDWQVVPQEELPKLQELKPTGVLVVSVLVGNGGIFREMARDLREFCPNASRHFLAGLGLPDTTESWNRLIQFLERSITDRKYVFSAWALLPVGIRHPSDCWSKYEKLHEKLDVSDVKEFGSWCGTGLTDLSVQMAKRALTNSQKGFLVTTAGSDLKLTEGFVYWSPDKEKIANTTQAGTYLAMSSVLQTAREFADSTRRLKSSGGRSDGRQREGVGEGTRPQSSQFPVDRPGTLYYLTRLGKRQSGIFQPSMGP